MEIEDVAEIPKPWQELMDQAGITSMRQLAQIAELTSHTTVNQVIIKGGTTSEENMEKIARALKVPVERLYSITSGAASRPLALPRGTEKLSERQKTAIVEIIRTMVEEKENAPEIVHKKSAGTTEQAQEKTASVTPIGDRKKLTPAQQRFEESGRKVARQKMDFPQDSPRISPVSSDTDE